MRATSVVRTFFQRVALAATCLYCLLFPGSVVTVAFDQVPAWGTGMGAGLLILQGLAVGAWLIGRYGSRGAFVCVLSFVGAWMVEHIGETTGLPFGRYSYTEVLQPQLLGVVPLAIPCAWLMVALGAWQLTGALFQRGGNPLLAATLVVAIDLQIETVATQIHIYWIWHDPGFYYGVPLLNFAGWWLVGLLMALVLRQVLERGGIGDWRLEIGKTMVHRPSSIVYRRLLSRLFEWIPGLLYLLSAIMFTIVNLAHGLILAGLLGMALLGIIALAGISAQSRASSFVRPAPAADRSDHSGPSDHEGAQDSL